MINYISILVKGNFTRSFICNNANSLLQWLFSVMFSYMYVVFLFRYWNAVFLYKDNLKYLQGTAYNLLRDFKLY